VRERERFEAQRFDAAMHAGNAVLARAFHDLSVPSFSYGEP